MLTTGYVTDEPHGEPLAECREAAIRANGSPGPQVIHVGGRLCQNGSVELHEGITDAELAALYSRTRYVSGLRRREGFELPVLEGLACGARPVCFDTLGYRHWYDGHAVFVPEEPYGALGDALTEVFARDPAPVTDTERQQVRQRFAWREITARFWREVRERLPTDRRAQTNVRLGPPAARARVGPCRIETLDVKDVEDGLVVHRPGSRLTHDLNASAAVIFELCDGTRSPDVIARAVGAVYHLPAPRSTRPAPVCASSQI